VSLLIKQKHLRKIALASRFQSTAIDKINLFILHMVRIAITHNFLFRTRLTHGKRIVAYNDENKKIIYGYQRNDTGNKDNADFFEFIFHIN